MTSVHQSSNNQHLRLIRLQQFQSIVQIASVKGFARTIGLLALIFLVSFVSYFFTAKKLSVVLPIAKPSIPLMEFTKPTQQATTVAGNFSTFHKPAASFSSIQSTSNPIPSVTLESDLNFENINTSTVGTDIPNANVGGWENIDPSIDGTGTPTVTNVQREEVIPSSEDFVFADKQPNVDLTLLQKNVTYPEMALRAGVEGKVVLKVLVLSTGKVSDVIVLTSDSDLLNEAAIAAVNKTPFTPAIQAKNPIPCWVTIPISFRIR
jgi:TonB family protein